MEDMSLKEALVYLDDIQTDVIYKITQKESNAIDVAIKAINKQIPSKLIEKGNAYICPSCGYWFTGINFCDNCGQKIEK